MSQCNSDEQLAVNCLQIIRKYSWLLDSFVLDFYAEDHWARMPAAWQNVLKDVSLEDLGHWMSMSDRPLERVWPLSLHALRASVRAFMMPRTPSVSMEADSFVDYASNAPYHQAGMPTSCLTHPGLKNLFLKHVKPKKRHEISKLASICSYSARRTGAQYVVDVGAGKGHLSRTLAYGYGLQMCCLEAQEELTAEARKLDVELEYTAQKHIDEEEMRRLHRPLHLNIMVDNSEDPNYLEQRLCQAFGVDMNEEFSFGIVGLHPCGDLAASLLRLFVQSPRAKFICIVGCCYMKLSVTEIMPSLQGLRGYPLSSFFRSLPHNFVHLSYEALEISCHALENYCQRLQQGHYNQLKIHSYRAALEKIITYQWPEKKHLGLRGVRHYETMDFSEYARAVLSRAGLSIPNEDLENEEVLRCLEHWERVVIFYSMRLLVAPLVEAVVLLDRMLCVKEQGASCDIISGFDPLLSPRNHILISYKPLVS